MLDRREDVLAPSGQSDKVSMKSHDRIAVAWERRKPAHVVALRSGVGSIPSVRRISQTVDAATFTPSVRRGLRSLFCLRVIQPSLLAFRRNSFHE